MQQAPLLGAVAVLSGAYYGEMTMDAQERRWEGYMAEMNSMFAAEAARAYAERKANVWEVFSERGRLPWMEFQVAPCDLPFELT